MRYASRPGSPLVVLADPRCSPTPAPTVPTPFDRDEPGPWELRLSDIPLAGPSHCRYGGLGRPGAATKIHFGDFTVRKCHVDWKSWCYAVTRYAYVDRPLAPPVDV